MDSTLQFKAKLVLAGLATLPAIASAATQVQPLIYGCSPYADSCEPNQGDLREVTGLNTQELNDSRELVAELNKLDVVTATRMNLTEAPRIPNRYYMPDPSEVVVARHKNLERLEKLRRILEAAK